MPVEVEGGEMIQTPMGEVAEVKGKSHEQGGVDMNLPQGTQVFSDRIKIKGKTMAERKALRMKKMLDLFNKVEGNESPMAKNSFKRMSKSILQEEEIDLAFQEMLNGGNEQGEFAYGTGSSGIPVYSRDPNRKAFYNPDSQYVMSMGKDDNIFQNDISYFESQRDTSLEGVNEELLNWSVSSSAEEYLPLGEEYIPKKPVEQPPALLQMPNLDNDFAPSAKEVEEHFRKPTHKLPFEYTKEDIPELLRDPKERFDPLIYGENPPYKVGEDFSAPKHKSHTISGAGATGGVVPPEGEEGIESDFTTGDLIGTVGQTVGAFAQMANTIKNAKATKKNVNHYLGFNEKALQANQEAIDNLGYEKEISVRDMARKLSISRNTSRNRMRNSASSVSSLRAGDLAVDYGIDELMVDAGSKADANYTSAKGHLLNTKTQLLSQKDQMVMGGEAQKAENDQADIDNFYSQFGANLAGISTTAQSVGKNLNESKYRKMFLKILPQTNKYGIGIAPDGTMYDSTSNPWE